MNRRSTPGLLRTLSRADAPERDSDGRESVGGTRFDDAEEASTYIAYSGPSHVDEEKKTLTHSMFVSLFPNWTGQTQPRVWSRSKEIRSASARKRRSGLLGRL